MLGLVLAALYTAPANADVLEVEFGEAHWISGPDRALPAEPGYPDGPLGEIPAEPMLFAENVVGSDAVSIPAAYAAKVAELSARFDLSPALIEALVWQESRWRASAVSSAGARGLTQLMPGTARDLRVDPADPLANLEGGARYLSVQLDRFDGDLEKALAAYNAGPGRVMRAGGVPRIRETQTYVAAILGRLSDHSRREN